MSEPSDALPRIAAHAVRREGKTSLTSTCSDKQIYHLQATIACIHVRAGTGACSRLACVKIFTRQSRVAVPTAQQLLGHLL